jgi:hypothetical protein
LGTSGALPTTVANGGTGPAQLTGFGMTTAGAQVISGNGNGLNSNGQTINLSPENYFFANATTLYVADSGSPKNGSSLGDGGLQKWSFANGAWALDYTLAGGLNLVANTSSSGSTGLYGLTGKVVGNTVQLYATNYTITDTGQTYLYGINDTLTNTQAAPNEVFTTLETAAADTNFKGVAFAPSASPVPIPASAWLLISAMGGMTFFRRQRRPA